MKEKKKEGDENIVTKLIEDEKEAEEQSFITKKTKILFIETKRRKNC